MIEKCYRLLDISSGNSNTKGTKVAANAQFDTEDNQGHLTENGEGGPGMVVTKQDNGMSTARSSQGLNRDQVGQLMALLKVWNLRGPSWRKCKKHCWELDACRYGGFSFYL